MWSGLQVFYREWPTRKETTVLYERMAVLQSLSSFHPAKSRAYRIVESQSLLAIETAQDRQAIVLIKLASWLERRSFRRADLIVAVSPGVKEGIVDFAGVNPAKVLVLPNATTSALATRLAEPGEVVRVGFVGAVVPWHRLERLIDAIASLEDHSVELEIVGDGPAIEDLRAHATLRGVAHRVRFAGRLPHSDALDRVATWSVGYAGHEKTWANSMYHSPLKLYEYAALGLQIVCTTAPDAQMLKRDGVAVHDFDPDDPAKLEAALLRGIEAARKDTDAEREQRRSIVAARHTWESRVLELFAHVALEVPGLRNSGHGEMTTEASEIR
ncbi:glycosyltransferase [Microbacterium aurantiacum]|uniref:glycosyltransferase n=1 Tax=Microbacterium aurantiacum TaxID=162393 RepID=UPI003D745BC3